MNPFHAAVLAFGAALAGCVGVPVDELLASTTIVAELQVESGARVEAARFSAGRAGESQPGWGRFIVSPFATESGASSGATSSRTIGSPSARSPGTSSRWG